ncbi:MAG: hypothetical protein SFV24_11520 [Gemmatimonadales bacterium]|nr:hypothetical protein [Gemmatimonadales bacterium]
MRLLVDSVLGDVGGAEAVLPVLEALQRRGSLGQVWAGPLAAAALERAGLPFQPLAEEPLARLSEGRATLLLTGTSWGDEPPELGYLEAARTLGIPSISVIDFWSNYVARFLNRRGDMILPDRIAVPDQVALLEAVAEGLPEDRLVVTGNPHYERLLQRYQGFDRDARLAFRERVGLSRTATVVLFGSQPLAAMYGDRLGYTEHTALAAVRNGLETVAEWIGHPTVLAIRRHPREAAAPLPASTSSVRVVDASEGDALSWALAADLVVGMTSALLLQTAVLGGRVVSVQPGLVGVDRLPSNRLGLSDGVFDGADVASALYRALARPAHLGSARAVRRARGAAEGAAFRLMDLIVAIGTGVVSEAAS